MKNLTYLLLLFAGISLSNSASAQCGATGVFIQPVPVGICEGDTANVTFSANGSCAGGNYEFEVTTGATTVQPWTTSTAFSINPTTTTLYTVSARCSACPGTVVSDTFSVNVTPQPSVSGITNICYNTSTTLTASGYTGTIGWYDDLGNQMSATDVLITPNLTTDSVTYFVQVSGQAGGGGGSILITECGLEGFFGGGNNEDYLEITNLYTTPVNTAGWVCAISNSYTNVNAVNSTLWNLPASFAPCAIDYRTDYSGDPNYWGSNMFWNGTSPGWAIVIDDVGNVVDFCAWGWTAAQLAGFNTMINGFNITLGTEWVGAGAAMPCQGVGGNPYSFSRTGNADNNDAGDFTCQATSLMAVNPGLSCGWSINVGCQYPTTVYVDMPPTASNAPDINVECIADVPAPDPLVITTEADDYGVPTVTWLSDLSDGLSCPETITRTYRVQDTCGSYVDVTQNIIIEDITAPVLASTPANITVDCPSDIPGMTDIQWTDNCDGQGMVTGVDVSNNQTCPEIITRTWTYTDNCGNTATSSMTITVHDQTPPTASNPLTQEFITLPAPDPSVVTDEADNCGNPVVAFYSEVSDGGFCPETVTRTYSITDDCGNQSFVTHTLIIGDVIPTANVITTETILSTLNTEVDFTNLTQDAVTYVWDFGDGSPISNEVNPTHLFPDEESGGYMVMLIAFSELGCTDTLYIPIQVWEELIYFIPNTFTPDGDEYNQNWQPVFVSGFDPYDFHLIIFNRWGEIMFESYNAEVGWDGTYHGEIVPQGTYTWKIDFKLEKNDARKMISGHLNIIR